MHWDLESSWLDKRSTIHRRTYIVYIYIYIYIRIHTHVVFLQLVPATARRNWIWSSNFPFLRWRSAFAATGGFLFRLLPFVWLILDEISDDLFLSSLSNSKRLTKSWEGNSMGGVSPIPRLQVSQTWCQLHHQPIEGSHCIGPGRVWVPGWVLTRIFGIWNSKNTKDVAAKTLTVLFLRCFFWLKNEVFAGDFYHEIGGISRNCQKNCNAKEEFCQPGHANLAKHVFVPILQVSGVNSLFVSGNSQFQNTSWMKWVDSELQLPFFEMIHWIYSPPHLWSNFCHVLILTFLGCSQDVHPKHPDAWNLKLGLTSIIWLQMP